MIVLSLFDGISCGRVALERAGVNLSVYYASEIDPYAIKIAQKNHPDTIQLGDVRVVRKMIEANVIGHVDLVMGGSPCQGFSFAGKQLAFNDPRSALFFEYVEILKLLKQKNPDIKFMLENVKMKQPHLDVITHYLGVKPVFINSELVSAQKRQRYYWANWSISQPKDRGILLENIIDKGFTDRKKSLTIVARYIGVKGNQDYMRRRYFNKSLGQVIFDKPDYIKQKQFVKSNPYGLDDNLSQIRPLSCEEIEKLFTLPVGYTSGVKSDQRYKMLGNGWETATLQHIFEEGGLS